MLKRRDWVLPVGYVDPQGLLHKQAELAPLTGREEELLAQEDRPAAVLVTELLSRCVRRIGAISDITPQLVRELTVADRQYLLLMLRQLSFGDRVQAVLPCPWPNCGKGVDIDFSIDEVPVVGCGDFQPHYELEVDSFEGAAALGLAPAASFPVRYRLPNGGDQEAVLDDPRRNEVEKLSTLLSRCILAAGAIERPAPEWVMQLPPDARLKIEQAMESRAPGLELSMDIECPECRRGFVAPFELQDFFFSELKMGGQLLFREVHYLAFHYHWSEHEIMSMPRDRRRRCISVLADEIEQLNAREVG
jgi:hypothetical protein